MIKIRRMKHKFKPRILILDVDGVLTDGKFHYSKDGKQYKVFGPDDHDAIKIFQEFLPVIAISADERGFGITSKRVCDDMGLELELVAARKRLQWIEENYPLAEVIYMGDGLFDGPILSEVGYGIAPNNASSLTKRRANYVTRSKAGEGAVAEACIHLLKRFFGVRIDELLNRLGK